MRTSFRVFSPSGAFLGVVRPDTLGPCWLAFRVGCNLGARFCEPETARDWLLNWLS